MNSITHTISILNVNKVNMGAEDGIVERNTVYVFKLIYVFIYSHTLSDFKAIKKKLFCLSYFIVKDITK